jgi:hypothetical protein
MHKSTDMTDEQLDRLILAQRDLLNGKLEIRPLAKHLRTFCRVWCSRGRIMERLRVVDPEGRKPKPPGRWHKRHAEEARRRAAAAADSQSSPQDEMENFPTTGPVQPVLSVNSFTTPVNHQPSTSAPHPASCSNDSYTQRIERLEAENEYLRSHLASENALLRAEIARLSQNAVPR